MAWQRIKGDSARRYINTETGAIISRHFYDTRYGTLKKQGFTGYHQKARATPVELRQSRPAPGRRKSRAGSLRHINPLAGRQTRNFDIMGDVVRTSDVALFISQFSATFRGPVFEKYAQIYSERILKNGKIQISTNKKIMGYGLAMTKITPEGETKHTTIWHFITKDDPPEWDYVAAAAAQHTYEGDVVTGVSFRLRFHDEHVKPALKKAKLPQLKIKR